MVRVIDNDQLAIAQRQKNIYPVFAHGLQSLERMVSSN